MPLAASFGEVANSLIYFIGVIGVVLIAAFIRFFCIPMIPDLAR